MARLSLALIAAALACVPSTGGPGARTVRQLAADDRPLRNPERGLAQAVDLGDPGDIAFVAGLGVSLASAHVRLDSYRDRPLDSEFLADLDAGFDRVRDAGLKLVLRFQYNNGSGKDAALPQMLAHIDQLAPLLHKHADIIAVLQAGFIGAWGEWHTSTNGATGRDDRAAVLSRLLAALPTSRSVQVRSPAFKAELFGGGPVTERTAHGDQPRARVGHHNDCLLADESDRGTYPPPVATWRRYLAADSEFVPVGGESCQLAPPFTDCSSALSELRRFHWSYLNRSYHPEVIATWKREGCLDAITRDLGYRLVLRRASWPASPRAGETIELALTVENLGFAAPFNPRPVFLVIGSGDDRREISLPGLDPRRWSPGAPRRIRIRVTLPDDLPAGTQPIALWFPDPAPTLRQRPAYAIRLANQQMWHDGDNVMGSITIASN